MTNFKILLLGILFLGSCSSSNTDLLEKVNSSLQQLESIKYTSTFKQYDTESASANWESTGTMVFDFTEKNALRSNIRATREGEFGLDKIFKEDTLYDIKSDVQTLVKFTNSSENFLYGNLVLYSSYYELKEILPILLNDSITTILQVVDTTLNGVESYHVQLQTTSPILAGKLIDEQKKGKYNLTVRKTDYLPIEWESVRETGYSKTTYSDLVTQHLADSVWDISEFEKMYLTISGEEYRSRGKELLKGQVGKQFPKWELPSLTNKSVSSNDFKDKLTLYEFFFVGCSGSIAAKPVIDELHSKYQPNGLQIVNIEIENNERVDVVKFIEKFGINNLTCYQGKELASQLGIYGCPTFVFSR